MEIKFCGKRLDNGDYAYGFYYVESAPLMAIGETQPDKHFIVFAGFADWNMPRMFQVEVDPLTVGQFICLIDKNGAEIYSRDIVKVNYHGGGSEIGYIDYDDNSRRFVIVFPQGERYGLIGFNDIEKLGTVRDNSELLKENS
ncbi:YopX family protein [Anaerospora hongkongensis]|uniref:YopX family protein n=1 Tax=Anaerospora hongkongensis TaxID=244830 RepID=UPI002898F426|nr:YopX family protein [Anaerospora hongkongensis]